MRSTALDILTFLVVLALSAGIAMHAQASPRARHDGYAQSRVPVHARVILAPTRVYLATMVPAADVETDFSPAAVVYNRPQWGIVLSPVRVLRRVRPEPLCE